MSSKIGLVEWYKQFRSEYPLITILAMVVVICFELALIFWMIGTFPGKGLAEIFIIISGPAWKAFGVLYAVGLFQLVVHEGGHALVAKLMGWEIKQINIGPITWQLRPTGWVTIWKQTKLMAAAGYVATYPKPGKYKAIEFLMIIAAGFMANLAVCLLIYSLLSPEAKGNPRDILWLTFVASVLCLITFPLLDAQYIFQVLTNKGDWSRRLEVGEFVCEWSNWKRPRDFDIEAIRRISSGDFNDNFVVDSVNLLIAYHDWDRGDLRQAHQLLSDAKHPPIIKAGQTELAFLEEMIPDMIRNTQLGMITAYSHPRHKAFQKYCSGDFNGCIAYAEKAIEKYKKYVLAHRPSADFQYELMELLIRKAKMQLNAPPVQ